jgi:hypothetical protein
MPLFTIEPTYCLPVHRHGTYEAASLAEACRLTVEDDDWESGKKDYETAGETYVTCAWEGRDCAYRGPSLPVFAHFDDSSPRRSRGRRRCSGSWAAAQRPFGLPE